MAHRDANAPLALQVIEDSNVKRIEQGQLVMETPPLQQQSQGQTVPFDVCMLCTQASAAAWLRSTGLPTGEPKDLLEAPLGCCGSFKGLLLAVHLYSHKI